jgi:hypothetical protein
MKKPAKKAAKKLAKQPVETSAKPRGNPRALAIAHLATVLEDPSASPTRKDKAARLLLSHAAAPAKPRKAAAGEPKGKKELEAEGASAAGKSSSKWAGLLQ